MEKKKSFSKKGELAGWSALLTGGAIAVLVAVMVVVFGLQFLTETQSTFTTNSAAYNATGDGITGLARFTDNIGLISLAIVLAVVIGLVVGLFAYNRR